MTVEEALKRQPQSRVVLARVQVGKKIVDWTEYDTGTDILYYYDFAKSVEGMRIDFGDSMIRTASQAALEAIDKDDQGFFWDESAARLWINPSSSGLAAGHVWDQAIALYSYHFGSEGKTTDNPDTYSSAPDEVQWDPRIIGTPGFRLSIPEEFGGIGQVGGGNLILNNGDGFFDNLTNVDWDSAWVDIYLGVDVGNITMSWDDYEKVCRFEVESWETNRETFTLRLKESSAAKDVSIPNETWNTDEFPDLHPDFVGDFKPIAYGEVEGATAVCVNNKTLEFRVAGHAIYAFRLFYDDGELIEVTSIDTNNASFIYSGWDGESEVTVDFIGKAGSDGFPISNSSDVVKDLLTTYLEADDSSSTEDLDLDSFSDARDYWVLGARRRPTREVHKYSANLYITNKGKLSKYVEDILADAWANIYRNRSGAWKLAYWKPVVSEGLERYTDGDVISMTRTVHNKASTSKVVVRYRESNRVKQVVELENEEWANRRGVSIHTIEEINTLLWERREADVRASRASYMLGKSTELWEVECGPRGLMLEPGDYIKIDSDDYGVDGVFEILEVDADYLGAVMNLVVSPMRGLQRRPLFLMETSATFPARLGGGSAANWSHIWSEDQKLWAEENGAYMPEGERQMVSDAASSPTYYPSTYRKTVLI